MLKKLLVTTALMATTASYACTVDGTEGIVEDNNLWIAPNAKSVGAIDEIEFNKVIDKVVKIYEPIIAAEGATLDVSRNWEDGTVNAYASRSGDTWQIHMFGGLARHETITSDGFALVVCHEIGHHIGGAPKKTLWSGQTRWATSGIPWPRGRGGTATWPTGPGRPAGAGAAGCPGTSAGRAGHGRSGSAGFPHSCPGCAAGSARPSRPGAAARPRRNRGS